MKVYSSLLRGLLLNSNSNSSLFQSQCRFSHLTKFNSLNDSKKVFDRIIGNDLGLSNSILIGYFRNSQYHEILRRYLNLKQEKIGLDSVVITFTVKSCIELGNLNFGLSVHVDALKFGLSSNRFVGTSLIGLYSKLEDIEDAHKVFDEITEKDIVVYTSIITGYSNLNDHYAYKAFGVVHDMQMDRVVPNRVTLVSLLQVASQLEALREGRSVHCFAIRRQIGCFDEVFETSLMNMYIKCSSDARTRTRTTADYVFEKMNTKSVGSWNAMIVGKFRKGRVLEALNMFSLMVRENVVPDLIGLANVILCCADLKYLIVGKSVHCYMIRTFRQLDAVTLTALVEMYSKCNKLVESRTLFDRMTTKDVVSFTVMMSGYLQNGFPNETVEIFNEMVGLGIRPNQGSILSALSALSDLKNFTQARSVHGYVVRNEFDSNTEIYNQMVTMYGKLGSIDYAEKVFNKIRYQDLISWTSIMMAYVSKGQADEAILLFHTMRTEKHELDSITLIALLQACSQLGYIQLVKEVHCRVYRVLMEKETLLINTLITTYAKCGSLNTARDLFEQMKKVCFTSWNTIISAHGMHGNSSDALRLFERMKQEKFEPDEATFTSVLFACSHSGLVEEGLQVFKSMSQDFSIIPTEEHYGCIVDMLSRAGRLEDAYDVVKRLPLKRSSSALGALLAACRLYGNTELGEVIGRRLLDLEPDNSSCYGLVSNLYAEGGKWDDVARIRSMVKKMGLKRTPGYSLIELD